MGMRPPTGLPSLSRRSRVLLIVALILAGLLLVGPRLIDTYTNWLWFGEVGYRSVYVKVLLTRILLFVIIAVIVGGVVFAALLFGYRTRPVFVPVAGPNDPIARYRTTVMTRLKLFGIGIPLVLGVLSGLVAQSNWVTVQLFLNGGDFGVQDPQFGLDVGFYAFDLPFYRMVLNWLFVSIVIAFFANLLTHYVFGGLRLAGREGALTRSARIQLAVLAGTFVLLKAIAYWFDRYSLLSSGRKEPTFTGASYTDINAVLPAKLILLSIAVICALAFFAGIFLRDLRVPAMATALLVLSSILVGAVWPLVVEQFSVRPNAADKESTYIERNIAATRQAYGITKDKVEVVDYPGDSTKNPDDVAADRTTIANTRLLDPNVLSRTFTHFESRQNVFGFPSTLDIDRYNIDGKLQDYVVAARELAPKNFTDNQRNWINQHTVFTHGNGFVAAPANTVQPVSDADGGATAGSGYPLFTVSDLASQKAGNQVIKVDQPRVYFGEVIAEGEPDYAIVGAADGSQPREYDSDNESFTYGGAGGVPIGNWFNRLAFAAKYTERNILFSGAIGTNSKIIFNRDPKERVQHVAPWLTTDGDAYPAVVNGRILWIVDAYTTLDNYPYAQSSSLEGLVEDSIDQTTGRQVPRKQVSYIRNSVKATVDAYDGTVKLYEVDSTDPVLKAWRGVFPGTVQPQSAISPELRAHFRYPEDLFKVQREMLAKYHVDNPREFFTNNSFWDVPKDPTGDSAGDANQPPYYVLLGEPDGKPTFTLSSAMRGFQRDFLSAYITVTSDPDDYGKFTVRKLPTDTQTQGPGQALSTMTSDPKVSGPLGQIGLTNRVIKANLLTLPIGEGGILYVEPLYTERNAQTGGAPTFPQLSKVLISYRARGEQNPKVGFADTLKGALEQVFGEGIGNAATTPGFDPNATVPPPGNTTPDNNTAPTPAPQPNQPNRDQALKDLNDAITNVRSAQLGTLNEALDRLQKAIDAYQKATG
ncbi:UPF0182 family protein [Antrihabitans stalactiti]